MIIYKYDLKQTIREFELSVNIPGNYQILDINFQENKIILWALVDPKSDFITVNGIYAIPTGLELPNGFLKRNRFLKTIYNVQRTLVYHIFTDNNLELK